MPKKFTITYREVASPITDLVTKFGGQPVWMSEPYWPLSRQYGTPMQFICQIALTAELFGDIGTDSMDSTEPHMAYLFVTNDHEADYTATTWDADGGENALILQPGGIWEGPTALLREGPSLYRRRWTGEGWERTPCEFAVELHPGFDPRVGARAWDAAGPNDTSAWDACMAALCEDKFGGTPVTRLDELEFRDPKQWRLLLQLNTKAYDDDPFFLDLADDGLGYAFLSKDGRRGKFTWIR